MSVWTDMMDRGTGNLQKKEDQSMVFDIETTGPYATKAEIDSLIKPTISWYSVDKNGFPKGYVPAIGHIIYVKEDCQFGKEGEILVYTGNDWITLTNNIV